jgi:hypothetical protein
MSDILDDETTAKIIKNIRSHDQDSPHFQATMVNFVWSLHQSDGELDDMDLDEDEISDILHELPTNPERELAYMD